MKAADLLIDTLALAGIAQGYYLVAWKPKMQLWRLAQLVLLAFLASTVVSLACVFFASATHAPHGRLYSFFQRFAEALNCGSFGMIFGGITGLVVIERSHCVASSKPLVS